MKIASSTLVAVLCCLCISSNLSAQGTYSGRGMQTAPPRDSMGTSSPRTIDFTDPQEAVGNGANRSHAMPARMPFDGQARSNSRELWEQALSSDATLEPRSKNPAREFWDKIAKPFQRKNANAPKPFQFPSNMNRKPNYRDPFRLTDQRGNGFPKIPNLLQPGTLQTPNWVRNMNQKTKQMFSFGQMGQGNNQNPMTGFHNWASRTNENWRNKSSQAWQSFTRNMNPQNWNGRSSGAGSINPPLRQANNWMSGNQTIGR